MDLKEFYFQNIKESEYHHRFLNSVKKVNYTYNLFTGEEETQDYQFEIYDVEEAITKFKELCQPDVNFSPENKCWFYLITYYLNTLGYEIKEFPRILARPPAEPADFTYGEIRNRIIALGGDDISIESQFEFCRYELKGGEAKEYKDKGYSGKNIERPDFQRLLKDIRAGLIRRVIVYKLDRISRSIVDFAKLMELFKQYNVEFVSCTEKFDTSTPMGRAMLNICIVFAQLERESIQMRVQDAFYSRCAKGYYMRGRAPYGFDTEPIVMDGIKTKRLVENAEMDYAELMYEMYAEPENSYGDITRYFTENEIMVYGKTLKRGFVGQLLRNPVYVQADMDIYEYFKAQGA